MKSLSNEKSLNIDVAVGLDICFLAPEIHFEICFGNMKVETKYIFYKKNDLIELHCLQHIYSIYLQYIWARKYLLYG